MTYSVPSPETITRVVLDNGIRVMVYENFAAQSVVIKGLLNAGAIFDTPEQTGLAAITAWMLMRGTQKRDFDTINAALEDIGADLGISAGGHRVNFSGKALAEDLPLLVDVLSDALRHPTFPSDQAELLRGQIITSLQYSQTDTRYRAGRAFREMLYPSDHPYHRSVRGTLQTVPLLSVEAMRTFHQRTYGPNEMIVVVVGAVKAADAIAVVRERLEDWRNPDQTIDPPLPTITPNGKGKRMFVPLPGKSQSDIVMGVVGPSRYAPDYTPANLANSILGVFGMMGRIGEVVREQHGLAYYASSHIEGGHGPSPWSVSAGVNPANVERAVQYITAELRRIISEPVTDQELEDIQAYYTGYLPLQLEMNDGIATTLLNMECYGLGLDYLVNYHSRIYSLTKTDLLKAAQHYLNPDALVIAVAGPEAKQTE
jgi:zinc protease